MGEKRAGRPRKELLGRSITEIAEITGMTPPEVSLALSGKRIFRRDKLKAVYEAGFPIEPFVFGMDYWEKVNNEQ